MTNEYDSGVSYKECLDIVTDPKVFDVKFVDMDGETTEMVRVSFGDEFVLSGDKPEFKKKHKRFLDGVF